MFYNLLRRIEAPNVRRLFAFLVLLLFPLVIPMAVVLGTAWHIAAGAKEYLKDLGYLITREVPQAARDFISVVRTGKEI